MRVFLLFLPVILVAQTAPPRSGAANTGGPAKSAAGTTAPKPAPARAATAATAATPALNTDDDKAIYALGLTVSRSLSQFDLSAAELEIFKRALTDAKAGKPALDINEWGPKIDPLARARGARAAEREKTASAAYLTKAAAEPGAAVDDGLPLRWQAGPERRDLLARPGDDLPLRLAGHTH